MTDSTIRGFEFRTQGENAGILSFIDAMRGLIARANGKDTDTMVLKAGGIQAMLMSIAGMAAFLVVTKNEELANILSDTAGFFVREDVAGIEDEMGAAAFADDGTLALMGLIEGVQSVNYDDLKAAVAEEAAAALEDAEPVPTIIVEEDEFESIEDEDDDWDDYEDDDDWDDDDFEDD